jgi:peptidoglycan hydrolase CwlO-like protein
MSESESYEEVTVASNGITVIKTFEADAFPVPAIAFRIKSDRTEAVTVRLVDEVPENVAVEDLGFHPEYGSEFWTIEDDEITFEREIESEEQYTTVYGIRATGTDDVEQFLTEPEIAGVDPPLEDEDGVVGGSGSDVVRDVISGDTDSVPGLDEEGDEDEDIGTLDLADPNAKEADEQADEQADEEEDEAEAEQDQAEQAEEDEAEAEQEDEEEQEAQAEDGEEDEAEETETESATNGAMTDIDSVATALATEIREGAVDDDDLEVLKEELDIEGGSGGGAVDARIESLQSNVADMEAYVDALEEFLEENGTGEDIITDVQDQIDDLKSEFDGFQSELDGLQGDIDENASQVESFDDDIGELKDDLQSLKGDIKDLDDDIEDVNQIIGDVEGELEDIDEVDNRIDDVEGEIEELKEWREQLSSVLGAADE